MEKGRLNRHLRGLHPLEARLKGWSFAKRGYRSLALRECGVGAAVSFKHNSQVSEGGGMDLAN